MSDSTARRSTDHRDNRTIAEIVAETTPMDDLKQFLIEDLTPDEEAAFYRVLEEASPRLGLSWSTRWSRAGGFPNALRRARLDWRHYSTPNGGCFRSWSSPRCGSVPK